MGWKINEMKNERRGKRAGNIRKRWKRKKECLGVASKFLSWYLSSTPSSIIASMYHYQSTLHWYNIFRPLGDSQPHCNHPVFCTQTIFSFLILLQLLTKLCRCTSTPLGNIMHFSWCDSPRPRPSEIPQHIYFFFTRRNIRLRFTSGFRFTVMTLLTCQENKAIQR